MCKVHTRSEPLANTDWGERVSEKAPKRRSKWPERGVQMCVSSRSNSMSPMIKLYFRSVLLQKSEREWRESGR